MRELLLGDLNLSDFRKRLKLYGVVVAPLLQQVVQKFTDPATLAMEEDGPAAVQQVVRERADRRRAWLKRGRDPQERAGSWRPRKRHRCGARRWLLHVDNAVRAS